MQVVNTFACQEIFLKILFFFSCQSFFIFRRHYEESIEKIFKPQTAVIDKIVVVVF